MATAAPPELEQSFGGGGDLLSSICPELGVAPLVDPGTDCEDELPTPACPPAVVDQIIKIRMDLKWPEMPSKVNFGHPIWPIDQK